jgi:hypothetical protein
LYWEARICFGLQQRASKHNPLRIGRTRTAGLSVLVIDSRYRRSAT